MRLAILCLLFAGPLSATVYKVGPGQTYTNINDAPLENIAAGDTLEIYWRSTPYAEKFVIAAKGTAANPIVVKGIPNASTGALPIITGNGATTRTQLNYWGESRGLIKLGGSSTPNSAMPEYITVEYLDVRSAHKNYTFTDDGGSGGISYADNAAAIYIENGQHIKIQYCEIHDSGNGIFCGPGGGVGSATLTRDIYIGYNYIHDNGNNSSAFEHNSYCESDGILYEYNHYGPTKSGAGGNNLKDRSGNCVIRYNWIEAGNRQLDLVDAEGSGIENLAGYDATYVYGNILIEPNGAGNSQIIHYGGDSGTTSAYRKGILHLYNNTIYSTRTGNTTLLRLSTGSETCDCRNNIIYVSAAGSKLAIIDDTGTANLRNNWLKTGYVSSHAGSPSGTVNAVSGNLTGSAPGWTSTGGQDFTLAAASTAINSGTTLHSAAATSNNVTQHYGKHQQASARPSDATLDMGAYEFGTGSSGTISITNVTLPNGIESVAYNETLTATTTGTTGPTYTWSVSSGAIPTGLTLGVSTTTSTTLSGTPTAAATYNFEITCTDGTISDTNAYTVIIAPAGSIIITTTGLSNGVISTSYSANIVSIGGTGALTWSVSAGTLPDGLILSGSITNTEALSGTPTTAGTFNFTLQVTDGTNTDTQVFSVTISTSGASPGGSSGGGGCTTGPNNFSWIGLIAIVCLVMLTSRNMQRG